MTTEHDFNPSAYQPMTNTELDAWLTSFRFAAGAARDGAEALEKTLRVAVEAQQLVDETAYAEAIRDLGNLDRASARKWLKALRRLGLPADLEARIDDVIERRNTLTHHAHTHFSAIDAMRRGEDPQAVIQRVQAISTDCDLLCKELFRSSVYPIVERTAGRSMQSLLDQFMALDIDGIENAHTREELRAARAEVDAVGTPIFR